MFTCHNMTAITQNTQLQKFRCSKHTITVKLHQETTSSTITAPFIHTFIQMNSKEQSKKRSRPTGQDSSASQQAPKPPKNAKVLAAVQEENNRLKVLHAVTVEHESLKAQVDVLAKSNSDKSTELEDLKTKIANLQAELQSTNETIANKHKTALTLKGELELAQTQLNAIHESWQQQVTEFASLESNELELKSELAQVQSQFHKDTQNLIAQRQRRKQLTDRLEAIRKAYESQGKVAQWHNIIRGSVGEPAIKKDCS